MQQGGVHDGCHKNDEALHEHVQFLGCGTLSMRLSTQSLALPILSLD